MVEAIHAEDIGNIRLFTDDALKLLLKLPDAALDEAFLLYPDPWPKTRHHKRRFVSPTTLAELARVLKAGAIFRFATDIEDYANWTLAHVLRAPAFRHRARRRRQAAGARTVSRLAAHPLRGKGPRRRAGDELLFQFSAGLTPYPYSKPVVIPTEDGLGTRCARATTPRA